MDGRARRVMPPVCPPPLRPVPGCWNRARGMMLRAPPSESLPHVGERREGCAVGVGGLRDKFGAGTGIPVRLTDPGGR